MIIFKLILLLAFINAVVSFFVKPSAIMYCGMVGFSGETKFDVTKIKMLMLANISRGVHSTGMYNDSVIKKKAVNAIEFLCENKIKQDTVFMGHDRHATVGDKTNSSNAHPFRFGTTIGQHNGTLKNMHQLIRINKLNSNDYDVDSQVLIKLIDIDKEELKVFNEFTGAAAVIWINTEKPDQINCFRNKERPLFYGMFNKGMYISSIESSLELIGCKDITMFEVDHHYVIEKGVIISKSKKRENAKTTTSKTTTSSSNSSVIGDLFNNRNKWNPEDVNRTSRWVKRTGESVVNFTKGEWYFLESIISNAVIKVIGNNGEKGIVMSDHFSPVENLKVNRLVVCQTGDGHYFKSGEIVYLRGLENPQGDTIATIEKLDDDENVYTWSSKNFRVIDQKQAKKTLKDSGHLISEYVETVEDKNEKEQKMLKIKHDFENNEEFIDLENNRLGVHWVEIGALYENLIQMKLELTECIDDLKNVCTDNDLSRKVDDKLSEIIHRIDEVEDDMEKEIDSVFDKAFDYYKPKDV